MSIWIVYWIEPNNTPNFNAFLDLDSAAQFIKVVSNERGSAFLRRLEINLTDDGKEKEQEPSQDEESVNEG